MFLSLVIPRAECLNDSLLSSSRVLPPEGPLAGMGISAPCPLEPCPAEHAHILSAFAYAAASLAKSPRNTQGTLFF